LRSSAATLDVQGRQRITRLLVKEVVVADDSIAIRHSIPTATRSAGGNGGPPRLPGPPHGAHADQSYLLRPWREDTTLRNAFTCGTKQIAIDAPGLDELPEQGKEALIGNPLADSLQKKTMMNGVEVAGEVTLDNPAT
jgi:hypothetical protein